MPNTYRLHNFQKAKPIPIKPTKIIAYPTSLPCAALSAKDGVCIKFASKLPPVGPVGSIPNLTCSPGSASPTLFAVFVYLPAGCLGKKAYCPVAATYSRYLPSQTALKSPTLVTLQVDVSPSTSTTVVSKETT